LRESGEPSLPPAFGPFGAFACRWSRVRKTTPVRLLMTRHAFFATAARHLESLLAEELRGLGLDSAVESRGGVRFAGTLGDAYQACLWSRVANRVLMPLGRFPAEDADALYAGTRGIAWEEHLDQDACFAVHLDSSQSRITHSRFGALKVKDAIADRFRDRTGRRPDVRAERPDLQIRVYLHRDDATVSLDLSGESLHRRGYREQGAAAPVKENLAAAILLRAGWPAIAADGGALVDPMCGSGTLPIEAALMAADAAPGLLRPYWGFLGWRQHDAGLWESLLEQARVRRAAGLERLASVRGYDQDPRAIRIALANLANAGLGGRVHFERRELGECAPGRDTDRGLVVVNPPYGERLGAESDLPALYARLGFVLRERFPGWHASLLTGNPDLGKRMGLRARRFHSLYNGPIECRLLHFEVAPAYFVSNRPTALPPGERGEGARMLANRLVKNRKNLTRWLRREDISCYRLYDADLPEYALAVDVYQGERLWVNVQEYEAPRNVDPKRARQRLREALGVIQEVLGVPENQLYFKVRRQQKGKAQYERLADTGRFVAVNEGGLRFLVNFEDYLDTGLFLDHRGTRQMLRRLAAGRHFLNLFAYTGTASVYAAAGGADSTTTVDMSNTYLDWARRNLALNGFAGPDHRLIRADCLSWLAGSTGRRRYGLIFLDPPSFSTSKRMRVMLDVQRDQADLIRATLGLLEPDGTLIFANNLRRFRLDSASLPDAQIEEITRDTLPRDFARSPRIHNCWRIRRAAPQI
jgi:23S rRNA (guanine2445-N2)-methyltransferase / 23S rRNA (guanine2069-N7)-methyltransferase